MSATTLGPILMSDTMNRKNPRVSSMDTSASAWKWSSRTLAKISPHPNHEYRRTRKGVNISSSIPWKAEVVIKLRGGSVLGKKTILKSGHFPGYHNKRFSPNLDDAPDYCQTDSLQVHGVVIPTIDGNRNVLKHIAASASSLSVLCIILREKTFSGDMSLHQRPPTFPDLKLDEDMILLNDVNQEMALQQKSLFAAII